MYVDDVASRVAQMHDIIGSEGHDLMTASTGESGIDLARACRPDLVILDLALPGMTGVEVIACLRASPETTVIPIIALSSAPCGSAPGLSMYCRRPLDVGGFSRLLRELLGPARGSATVRTSGAPPGRSRLIGDAAPGLDEKPTQPRRSSVRAQPPSGAQTIESSSRLASFNERGAAPLG